MTTETAIVETLTAEVRVLMVGNRQVTLSVYRQLDKVRVEDMEPFGRVSDSRDQGLWLVGRSAETGALVRGESFKPDWRPLLLEEDLSSSVTLCSRLRFKSDRDGYSLRFQGRSILAAPEVVEFCEVPSHGSYGQADEECDGWRPNGLEAEIGAVISAFDAAHALYKSHKALPLIVLAGLR